MLVPLACLSVLSLLNGNFSASNDDWVTIQNGQFYLGEEPFFPIGSNYFDNEAYFLSRIESRVNVFRLSASWLDFPETDDIIYNVFGIEEGKSGVKLEAGFRLAEERGVFLLVNLFQAPNYHFPFTERETPFEAGQTIFNISQGGPCNRPEEILTHPESTELMKARVRKVVDRWGNSSAIFAWDLMNELNLMPNPEEEQAAWVEEIGEYIKEYELGKYGRYHLRTVSSYKPEPEADFFYNSPGIDFASTHMYHDSVLSPRNAISSALDGGASVGNIIQRIGDDRPYLDTEHCAILGKPEYKEIIPKAYDNLAWAELAAGAAGPGLPIGPPGGFLPAMRSFASLWLEKAGPVRPLELTVSGATGFGSLREEIAVFWFIKDEEQRAQPEPIEFAGSGLQDREYELIWHSTSSPEQLGTTHVHGPSFSIKAIPFDESIAAAIRPLNTSDR